MGLRVSSNKNVEMMCKINLVVLEGGRFDDMFLVLFCLLTFFFVCVCSEGGKMERMLEEEDVSAACFLYFKSVVYNWNGCE